MFSYTLCRLDSIWVIIFTSSIITTIFCKAPLKNSSSVIQSSGSLVTSSNSNSENFFRSPVLEAPSNGWNFLFNFSHARKAHLLGNSLVTDYSTIWKHTVSSCANIRSLYAFLFSCFSIAYSLVFSALLSAGVFMVPLMMILYPSSPAFSKNFPDHISHLSRYPLKEIILMLFSSVLLALPWWWSLVSPKSTLKYVGGLCEPLLV